MCHVGIFTHRFICKDRGETSAGPSSWYFVLAGVPTFCVCLSPHHHHHYLKWNNPLATCVGKGENLILFLGRTDVRIFAREKLELPGMG